MGSENMKFVGPTDVYSEMIRHIKKQEQNEYNEYKKLRYNPDGTERVTLERLSELVEADKEGESACRD